MFIRVRTPHNEYIDLEVDEEADVAYLKQALMTHYGFKPGLQLMYRAKTLRDSDFLDEFPREALMVIGSRIGGAPPPSSAAAGGGVGGGPPGRRPQSAAGGTAPPPNYATVRQQQQQQQQQGLPHYQQQRGGNVGGTYTQGPAARAPPGAPTSHYSNVQTTPPPVPSSRFQQPGRGNPYMNQGGAAAAAGSSPSTANNSFDPNAPDDSGSRPLSPRSRHHHHHRHGSPTHSNAASRSNSPRQRRAATENDDDNTYVTTPDGGDRGPTSGPSTPQPEAAEAGDDTGVDTSPAAPQEIEVIAIAPALNENEYSAILLDNSTVAELVSNLAQQEPSLAGAKVMFFNKYIKDTQQPLRSVPLRNQSIVLLCSGQYMNEHQMSFYLGERALREANAALATTSAEEMPLVQKGNLKEQLMQSLFRMDAMDDATDEERPIRKDMVKRLNAMSDRL